MINLDKAVIILKTINYTSSIRLYINIKSEDSFALTFNYYTSGEIVSLFYYR